MKQLIYFILLIGVFSSSCNQAKNSTEVKLAESVNETKPEVAQQEEINPDYYTYGWRFVAGIELGDDIMDIKQDTYFKFKEQTEVVESEGDKYEIKKLVASDNDTTLFEIIYTEDAYLVEEIKIISPKFKNFENIGIGNTIREFKDAYPHAQAFYSYVSGLVWLESGYKSVQFILNVPDRFYQSIKIDSDLMEIPLDKLDNHIKISNIRIHGSLIKHDISGNWKSEDNNVQAKITPTGEIYHIALSTGKDIYNQHAQDLISYYDMWYSLPEERVKIIIHTYELPNSIHLILDDHEELEPLKVTLYPKD